MDLKPAATREEFELPDSARNYPMSVNNAQLYAPGAYALVNDATVTSE